MTTNKLREVIAARQIPLGTTEQGKDWCLKALHPADPLTVANGIPDMSSVPSVFQNFSCSYTVMNPLPGTAGNWDFDVFYYAHPYLIGALRTVNSVGAVVWSPIVNPHIPGETWQDKRTYVYTEWERYRLGYLGVTGYHDAAALSNNGLIAVSQYQQAPMLMHADDSRTSQDFWFMSRMGEGWPSDVKNFSELQNMPNAYFGVAREGCYAPYRLSEVCQDWVSAKDTVRYFDWAAASSFSSGDAYLALPGAHPAGGPYGVVGSSTGASVVMHRRSDTGVIHISGRQFAQTASFTTYYRSGWEIQVTPGSSLSSFAHTSPEHDPVALGAYYAISRQLKDAYPADYNDLGKIVRTIADVAGGALSTIFPQFAIPIRAAQGLVSHIFPEKKGDGAPVPNLLSQTQMETVAKEAKVRTAKKKVPAVSSVLKKRR